MPSFELIPGYTFPLPPPPPATTVSERSSTSKQRKPQETQLAVCALNEPLRYGWGRVRLGAQLLRPIVYLKSLYVPFVIARGPIYAVDAIEFDNKGLGSSVIATVYPGITPQPIDPVLEAAAAAQNPPLSFTDDYSGVAWGHLKIPRATDVSLDNLTITARLLLVYDPRDGAQSLSDPSTWQYSTNPSLALANWLASPAYGRGETLDWASVADSADVNDQLVGGKKRREIGMVVDSVRKVDDVETQLAAYAGVWVVREGGITRLVPDAPSAPVFTFTNAAGSANYVADSLTLEQRSRANTPTVVTVVWTDTTQTPWAAATSTEKAEGVDAGLVPWREEVVDLPGIQDAGQARREALRRLNEYVTSDLIVTLIGTGEAAQLRRGDVVNVTDSGGLSAKPFRLMGHAPAAPGLWSERLMEYDDAFYQDVVAEGPGSPDTSYPSPANPPTVTGLAAVEDFYATVDGSWASRLSITWDDAEYPPLSSYLVEVFEGSASGALVYSVNTTLTGAVTPPLEERRQYVVSVKTISTALAESTAATLPITPQGKFALPTDVTGFNGFESGGSLYLRWLGVSDVDLDGYEVRYGAVGVAWEAATLLDRVYTLALVSKGIVGSGTWDLLICSRDTLGQYSANPARLTLVVTEDLNQFLLDAATLVSPTLTGMVDVGTGWLTSAAGDDWDYGATGPNWEDVPGGASTPWAIPSSVAFSEWLSESVDFGLPVAGTWSVDAALTVFSGAVDTSIELSPDGASWTSYAGASTVNVGRFARVRLSSSGGAFMVARPCVLEVSASAREEEFADVMSSASAPVTVVLGARYAKAVGIFVTPKGAGPYGWSVDNVLMGSPDPRFDVPTFDTPDTFTDQSYEPANSFDFNVFDGTNVRVAVPCYLKFKGI